MLICLSSTDLQHPLKKISNIWLQPMVPHICVLTSQADLLLGANRMDWVKHQTPDVVLLKIRIKLSEKPTRAYSWVVTPCKIAQTAVKAFCWTVSFFSPCSIPKWNKVHTKSMGGANTELTISPWRRVRAVQIVTQNGNEIYWCVPFVQNIWGRQVPDV